MWPSWGCGPLGDVLLCVSAGLLKTHNLSFQDSESLQAVFDKDSSTNVLKAQPRFGSLELKRYIKYPIPFCSLESISGSDYVNTALYLPLKTGVGDIY